MQQTQTKNQPAPEQPTTPKLVRQDLVITVVTMRQNQTVKERFPAWLVYDESASEQDIPLLTKGASKLFAFEPVHGATSDTLRLKDSLISLDPAVRRLTRRSTTENVSKLYVMAARLLGSAKKATVTVELAAPIGA